MSKLRQASNPKLITDPPPQPKERKPGQLTDEQLKQFFDEGYLMVPNFFRPDELQPVIDAAEANVDELIEDMYANGKITDKHADAGVFERLILVEKDYPGASVLLHKRGFLPKAFQDLWTNERLLNVAEQMIGPDISGHPVWNLRPKTPSNEQATVPWHQDNAYLNAESDELMIPAAWIPLLDANKINGCMEMVKGGDRKGVIAKHTCCAGATWYVDLSEEEMEKTLGVSMKDDVVLCEVPFGGVLFLNNFIPHRSLENRSDRIRWSLDLRWMVPDKPNGFYGLKDSVRMRKSSDPNYKPEMEEYAKKDKATVEGGEPGLLSWHQQQGEERFSPIITGPWMNNWEMVHQNKHTDAWLAKGRGDSANAIKA